jgi:prepilin-type N-terminal cleavage/methylation domain-containing protein
MYGGSIMNTINKKAFTLIELLVVVLIIGILAAIALPQYQKAVIKARIAEMILITKKIEQSQREYFLIHSRYAKEVQDLSGFENWTNCSGGGGTSGAICTHGNFRLFLVDPSGGNFTSIFQSQLSHINNTKIPTIMFAINFAGIRNAFLCYVPSPNVNQENVCKMYGERRTDTDHIMYKMGL